MCYLEQEIAIHLDKTRRWDDCVAINNMGIKIPIKPMQKTSHRCDRCAKLSLDRNQKMMVIGLTKSQPFCSCILEAGGTTATGAKLQ